MKKKQIISKLKFQKTTVVSFNAMKNIIGRSLVNVDTEPITITSIACPTELECHTQDNKQTCLSCTNTECTRPTTTANGNTDYCGTGTFRDCLDTRGCY
ncbi:hypothetical protein [Kordia sp. SMS9]|uniref:hypothetical protein n=1 Tax=Kordia sp. SMS9 TaxID=2282170 RepID=UPI0013B41BD8|nr:hypothetical protein [Kordia sp. SMS9]